jgi:hypothetical protein
MTICRFYRGQSVYVESKEAPKVSAVITAVGTQEVCVNKYAGMMYVKHTSLFVITVKSVMTGYLLKCPYMHKSVK